MKKFILYIIIIIVAAWALQTYTSFKALDLAETWWQKIDSQYLQNIDWSKLNIFSNKKTPDPEKQLNIFIRDNQFIPNFNPVKVGIKVTWFNEDNKNHTVTGDSWGSGEIAPGKAWSKTFDTAGDYKYHCSLYPSMTGEVIVK
ncbi:cupredoxin domain-containing protein [Patescibacteria group bacterium]|nr:cupredoxin domain-containing protein [Patescibacteria group bacterium]